MFRSKEEQFDFYWKEIFTGLAYNPIEFNTYRFDQTMSLPGKVNKLYELFKVLALNNQEVMDYLKAFVETFDVKLYESIEDVLEVMLADGRLADVVRVAISEEVIEARTDNKEHTYQSLKDRLDSELEVVDNFKLATEQTHQEFNTQLAQTLKVGTEKRFKPEMMGTLRLTGLPRPYNEQIDKYIAMGFSGAVITLHLEGNDEADPIDDVLLLFDVLEYAKQKNFKTNVIKFHAVQSALDLTNPTIQANYVSKVLHMVNVFKEYGVDTVYLFNEFGELFRTQTDFCINTINTVKSLGFKVGVTFQYNASPNFLTYNLADLMRSIPQLFQAVDIIGLNMYPPITQDWRNATRNDSIRAWENVYPIMEQMIETFGKPIIFTEVGCHTYYQFLSNPALWDNTKLDDQRRDEEATRIFWYGLLNNERIQNIIDGVYTWYLEFTTEPETFGFFKHYNERV